MMNAVRNHVRRQGKWLEEARVERIVNPVSTVKKWWTRRKEAGMRALAICAAMMLALLVPISSDISYAQQGSTSEQSGWLGGRMGGGHMMGRETGPGGWYCPWMGGGCGYHHMMGGKAFFNRGEKPLTKAQVEQLVSDYYIEDNSNLKIGGVADKGDFYDATVVTKKEGALVQRIHVDKKTGWFRNVQ